MTKSKSGFTIVELLIVIVVIAILAAISIVAYNGIQTRAKNTKTTSAAVGWIKALKLYNADKGNWPAVQSCLGKTTTYVGDGGQCLDNAFWTVSPTFLSVMAPYISNYPEPDTTNITAGTANSPYRGIFYTTDTTTFWNIVILSVGTGSCPDIGLKLAANSLAGSGRVCRYDL